MKQLAKYLLLVLSLAQAVSAQANDFYTHASGAPATGSQASSATMRAEFDAIAGGFNKMPTLTGNGDELVLINAGATAMTSKTAAETRTFLDVPQLGGANIFTNSNTFSSGSLIFPQAASPAQTAEGSVVWDTDDFLTVGTGAGRKTMVDTDSAQTLTNKTITSPTLNGSVNVTGTLTAGGSTGGALPSGTVLPYAGSAAPAGFLLCNGQAVSRTTYSGLFSVIGTTYGAGDGSTTFNLPDARGRTAIGAGAGSGLTNRVLAATGGAETHTLTQAETPLKSHGHGVTDPGHSHSGANYSLASGGSSQFIGYIAGDQPSSGAANTTNNTTGITIANASDATAAAHNIMQPWLALNYVIKY